MPRHRTIPDDTLAAIHQLRSAGLSQRQIAQATGLARSLVAYHLNADRMLERPRWLTYALPLTRRWPHATAEELRHLAWLLEEAATVLDIRARPTILQHA